MVFPEISFYHLCTTPLEAALPKLLEKILQSGNTALILCGSAERVAALDLHLWSYTADSFLPHGTEKIGFAAQQPIWITHTPENANQANFLILLDQQQWQDMSAFQRCLIIFDGSQEEAVIHSRQQWQFFKQNNASLAYFKQQENGSWMKK